MEKSHSNNWKTQAYLSFKHSLWGCTDESPIVGKDPVAAGGLRRPSSLILRWSSPFFVDSSFLSPSALLSLSLHNDTEFCGEAHKTLFLIKALSRPVIPSQTPAFASLLPVLRRANYSSGLPKGFPVSCFWRMQAVMGQRDAATMLSFFPGNFFSEATE